jgi:hypothetical protein
MKRTYRSMWTLFTVAAAVVVGSIARADIALQISASASEGQMQGKPFQISVALPKGAYPDPDWLPTQNRIPMPDSLLTRGTSGLRRGTLEVRGLPDATTQVRRLGILGVDSKRFLMNQKTFHRIKMTSEAFGMRDVRRNQAITAVMVVNMTDMGGVRLFHVCVRNTSTGEIVFQSGKPYPDPDWMPFSQTSGWISIAPLPSP